jgi:hypothetical protein
MFVLFVTQLGTQLWVWGQDGNPEPSAGSRFWTQTRTQLGLGPGWVRVLLGRAEAYSYTANLKCQKRPVVEAN